MSYRTILTYWDSETASEARVEMAGEIARRFGGHLSVVSFGYEPDIPPYAFGGTSAAAMADFYGQAKAEAEGLAQKAQAVIEKAGVPGGAEPVVSTYSGLSYTFGEHAKFADLVVLTQPYESTFEQAAVNLLEGALFDGDAATLVLPAQDAPEPGSRVVIGWNGSREALRAVRRSLPFLAAAESVEIAIIEPDSSDETPGEDLALMLSRHGIKAEIRLLPKAAQSVSEALRQHCVDAAADLLVMGGYGHSRFREYILGGVTRDILGEVPVPVLLAH